MKQLGRLYCTQRMGYWVRYFKGTEDPGKIYAHGVLWERIAWRRKSLSRNRSKNCQVRELISPSPFCMAPTAMQNVIQSMLAESGENVLHREIEV